MDDGYIMLSICDALSEDGDRAVRAVAGETKRGDNACARLVAGALTPRRWRFVSAFRLRNGARAVSNFWRKTTDRYRANCERDCVRSGDDDDNAWKDETILRGN